MTSSEPFQFQVVRKSFSEFLDSYLDLSQSGDAPTPPWVIFTQLPTLQQRSGAHSQRSSNKHPTGDAGDGNTKRKPRVVFDDEVKDPAGSSGVAASEGSSAHRQAVMKRMKSVMTTLHIQPNVDLSDAAAVREYFAVKSLVEYLPQQSMIANTSDVLLSTPAFLAKVKEVVDQLAVIGANQHAVQSARFKRLALRRAGGAAGAEGAIHGHHFGAKHSFQLFLRSVLAATPPEDRTADETPHLERRGSAVAGKDLRQAKQSGRTAHLRHATVEVQKACSVPQEALRIASSREAVLDSVEVSSGLPARVVSPLHLLSHSLQKDPRFFGKIGASDNLSSADGLSVAAGPSMRRAVSAGQLSTASSRQDLRSASNQSSGVYGADAAADSGDNSDTKSVRSSAPSHKGGGGHHTSQNAPYVCPTWQLKHHEFWISLKGIVFKINACHDPAGSNGRTIPFGRALYYRLVLLPIFSGRDCTVAFAWLQRSCIAMDYCGIEDYVSLWRSKLFASSAAQPASSSRNPPENNTEPLGSPQDWPRDVKDHINRLFALFMCDFDVVGELEGGEYLWF